MISLLATLLAELVGFAVVGVATAGGALGGGWVAVGELLLFVAAVTGLVNLGLMLTALRLRKRRPPRAIIATAWLIGTLPWLAIALRT
jgi:hypothetical protein